MPGIGYFTLSLRGELDEKQRIRPETATLKINCRIERELVDTVNREKRFEFMGE